MVQATSRPRLDASVPGEPPPRSSLNPFVRQQRLTVRQLEAPLPASTPHGQRLHGQ